MPSCILVCGYDQLILLDINRPKYIHNINAESIHFGLVSVIRCLLSIASRSGLKLLDYLSKSIALYKKVTAAIRTFVSQQTNLK